LNERARILIDKGTNRFDFERGLISKYECIDLGSSFLSSELQAAFLYGQLQEFSKIQERRLEIWDIYFDQLSGCEEIDVPFIPDNSVHSAHCFYLTFGSPEKLKHFSDSMKAKNIPASIHFQPLHRSPFFSQIKPNAELPYADYFADCLVRLPLHYLLSDTDLQTVISATKESLQLCAR